VVYSLLTILQIVFYAGALVALSVWFYHFWQSNAPKREHLATKARLKKVPVLEPEEAIDPQEARQRNLKFLGVPSVQAGSHILYVPSFSGQKDDPDWVEDQEVMTTARAVVYTKQGTVPADLTELSNGYLLVATGNQKLLLKKHDLTTRDTDELEKQRQDAVDSADKTIESFAGHKWNIVGAFGTNYNPKPGERECSYVQVLSVHPNMGEPGFSTVLPTNLLDGKEHDYYDLRARNLDTGEILYDFYAGGSWSCFIGRPLTEDEITIMKGI